ncbi:AI-2E family transporter [Saccharothrix sp. NPDC042600]|uniref:AI-2E family transporter n=1 Tax=Saccharothrix TaxID=2071 RepID=UPI0033F59F29|nr:AI-2E family transporter [Saccharothrix mutabilis subsp. capreolus]
MADQVVRGGSTGAAGGSTGTTAGDAAGDPPGSGVGVPRGLALLSGCASVVVVVAGVRAAAWLVTPALLALVVVIAVGPVRAALRRRGVPRWVETTGTVAVVYGVVVLCGLVVAVSAAELGGMLPDYVERGRELLARGSDVLDRVAGEPGRVRAWVESLDTARVLTGLGALLGDVAGLATNLVFLLALLFFLSVDGVEARLAELSADRPRLGESLRRFAHRTRRYLVVTTVFGLAIAAVDTVALWALGVGPALLWGLLSFVTNYIPNIGFLLGLAPPAVLALLEHGGRRALLVVVVYVVVNFVGQSLVQPRFAGGAVGLSTTAAFVALVFWGWVLGPLGMVLAVPATLLVSAVLVDVDPRARWVTALVRSARDG